MKTALIIISCFFCFKLFAKPSFDTLSIRDNSKLVRLQSESQAIFFFCPINSFSKELYLENFNKLYKKSKIQVIENVSFKLVFFYRSINKSKGLNVYFSDKDTLVLINDFETYFLNFDRKKVEKTSVRLEVGKRYVTSFKSESNLSLVCNSDIFCFNNLAERIPEYEFFITQLINPIYSDAEKIMMLNDIVTVQQLKLDSLSESFAILLKQYESVRERIERIENPKPNEDNQQNKKAPINPISIDENEKKN